MEKTQISMAAARVNAGLTQHEAAKKLGISYSTLVNWEKGRTAPTVPMMERICSLYNIPQDFIFLPVDSTKSRT